MTPPINFMKKKQKKWSMMASLSISRTYSCPDNLQDPSDNLQDPPDNLQDPNTFRFPLCLCLWTLTEH